MPPDRKGTRFLPMASLVLGVLWGFAGAPDAGAAQVRRAPLSLVRAGTAVQLAQAIRAADQTRRATKAAPRMRPSQEVGLIERLLGMPPAQRRRAFRQDQRLRGLTPEQRRQLANRLQRLSQMPPQQRQEVLERLRLFDRLPPQKQRQARAVYGRWQQIPQERRAELLQEFDGLRDADPKARSERLASDSFVKQYNEEERTILHELADLLPDGPAQR